MDQFVNNEIQSVDHRIGLFKASGRLPVINSRIGDKKAIGIPQRNQNLSQNQLDAAFCKAQSSAFTAGYASYKAESHRPHIFAHYNAGSG